MNRASDLPARAHRPPLQPDSARVAPADLLGVRVSDRLTALRAESCTQGMLILKHSCCNTSPGPRSTYRVLIFKGLPQKPPNPHTERRSSKRLSRAAEPAYRAQIFKSRVRGYDKTQRLTQLAVKTQRLTQLAVAAAGTPHLTAHFSLLVRGLLAKICHELSILAGCMAAALHVEELLPH